MREKMFTQAMCDYALGGPRPPEWAAEAKARSKPGYRFADCERCEAHHYWLRDVSTPAECARCGAYLSVAKSGRGWSTFIEVAASRPVPAGSPTPEQEK